MGPLAHPAIYIFLDNPKSISISSVMSNKMSTPMIASTYFYSNVPMLFATSTKIYLSELAVV